VTELRVERHMAAPPSVVYSYLTDSKGWAAWQGEEATIEARPGGIFRMKMAGGQTAGGQFMELVPDRRVVFTWGWVDTPGIPAGSTTVEIDLVPDGEGTLVRLTHRNLPPEESVPHRQGWEHYLGRLGVRAEGGEPGPDPGPG
jgi:uncharacterized protein YndB with AHSA1/START domain